MKNAKNGRNEIISRMANNLPGQLRGTLSPYPTVLAVTIAQYIPSNIPGRYRELKDRFPESCLRSTNQMILPATNTIRRKLPIIVNLFLVKKVLINLPRDKLLLFRTRMPRPV